MNTYLIIDNNDNKIKVRSSFKPSSSEYKKVLKMDDNFAKEPVEALEVVEIYDSYEAPVQATDAQGDLVFTTETQTDLEGNEVEVQVPVYETDAEGNVVTETRQILEREEVELNTSLRDQIIADRAAAKAAEEAAQAPRIALRAAKKVGNQIEEDFAVENITMGITADGMTGQVLDAMTPVLDALRSGSLYEAMDRIKAVPTESKDPKYVTDARLLEALNRIEQHLGLPQSSSLN